MLETVEDAVLEDVVGLTVAVDASTRDRFVEFCGLVHYEVESDPAGGAALHGPDFALRLVPAGPAGHGVKEVHMRTRKSSPAASESRFGLASLRLDGRSAVLSFP